MSIKKRLISGLTCVAMIAAAMAVPVSEKSVLAKFDLTASAETYGDYEYIVLDDETILIAKYKGNDTELIIPSFINGMRVSKIGTRAFEGCESITSITISNSITSVDERAFSSCGNLTSITIPDSVISIGKAAFYDCTHLTEVTIGDGVTIICDGAFSRCLNLVNITIPESVTSIGERIFSGCTSFKSINVSDNNQVYSSMDGILYNKDGTMLVTCPEGKTGNVVIPNSVTAIGDQAFSNCSNLVSITIPESVTSIGESACYHCKSLKSITIPNSVTTISDCSFRGCSNLMSVTISDRVTSIGNGVFWDCKSLMNVTIPDGVTSIGVIAFCGCLNLTSITIPNSVTSIDKDAFYDCINLSIIKMPKYITNIGEKAFGYYSDEDDLKQKKIMDFTIYGYKGSAAETYANEYGFAFIDLSGDVPHTHSYTSRVTKAATCTTDGVMTYTCSCGETYTEPIIASGHKYVDTVVDPTCTESGYTLHKCSACGDSYKDTYTLPADHNYISKVTKAATCTTSGVRTYLCTECGDTYTETITATGHQYEVRVVAPTTESQGYTEHTCSVCGDSYRDNYTDKLPYTDITTCTATLSASSYTYDGTAKKPTVTVKNGSTTLKSGTDYTVAYKNNTNAGTATVTITGKGSYTGTASKTFTIKKASIANFTATLSASTYTYNGSAKKPTVTVKNGSKTLTSSDYTVAYKNNTAVGTATVTVTGKGNYSGTLSKTFTINLANVTGFKNVAVSANAIKFTWNKVSGADGYVVYLYNKSAKQWQRYAKTTGGNNVQLVNKLNPGEAYALTARAYKTVGGKEVLSPSFTNFKTSTNPAKVSFSVSSKTKGSATYSWKKVTGATSYALYYKASLSASWTKVATVSNSTTSYTKTGLKSGTGYFTVRAFRTYEGTSYGSAFDTKTVSVK